MLVCILRLDRSSSINWTACAAMTILGSEVKLHSATTNCRNATGGSSKLTRTGIGRKNPGATAGSGSSTWRDAGVTRTRIRSLARGTLSGVLWPGANTPNPGSAGTLLSMVLSLERWLKIKSERGEKQKFYFLTNNVLLFLETFLRHYESSAFAPKPIPKDSNFSRSIVFMLSHDVQQHWSNPISPKTKHHKHKKSKFENGLKK